jgi:hypothetical protein
VIGNEVLLRGEMTASELAAAIRSVKAQVAVPVTYADAWELWPRNRELNDAVDFVTVHILPFWENFPVRAEFAAAHADAIRQQVAAAFPGKQILIGEIGWPSEGRMNADAATISLDFNSIRRLKNKKSIRVIPVVDDLAIHQLRVRAARASNCKPTDPFFPRYGWDGGGNTASAALGKWLTKIGLRDPKADEVKTTHSLRHTFKDALREANIHRDIANMLQGHTAGDAASRYGSSELLEAKRQAAEKAWALILSTA